MTTYALRTEQDRFYPIPGLEARFVINLNGVVKSLSRIVNSPAAGGSRRLNGKNIKIAKSKGYPVFGVNINGKRKSIYIHRVLAQLFIPNPENKPEINHINGIKGDFRLSNLEWCTHKENMSHAFKTGLAPLPLTGKGESSPSSKLKENEVVKIKILLKGGATHSYLAKMFGVSKGNIGFISRGETWSHVEI